MDSPHESVPTEPATLLPRALHALRGLQPVDRGSPLLETGRRPAAMRFVSEGDAVLRRLGEGGEVLVPGRVRHGIVGKGCLQPGRYHCDASVVADADFTHLPRQALQEALRSDEALALGWIGMLNQEARRLRQQSERLSRHDVRAVADPGSRKAE